MPVPVLCPGHASPLVFPSTGRLPSTTSAAVFVSALFGASQVLRSRPNSSHLPRRLRLYDFPARPGAANAATGDVRSPKFRRFPFIRNGVSDHGRAVTPRIAVHNILPSTSSNVSASARLNFSRLNIPLRMIAVYASQPPSPATTQHSLEGGSLLPYPRRTCTGWKAPASLGARRGREPGYPGPPAQIPASGFPAPGSCRRSNATEVRGLSGPCTSDP